ncbi:OsmC family protein [uncultured Piscinibacter sp.]|uniref:OsmC family protein n=1 Tax=uncultured Piscinibacter sp. TaxID=1131835 RepID=UPI00262F3272|nr:OsmC family protein [uncultured Piscinibacter sp.]
MTARGRGVEVDVRDRQAPLRARYRSAPETAMVVDHASIASDDLHDPLHGQVRAGSSAMADITFAVHGAIGGLHDAPVPGDLLCAALASCQESSLRMVANVYRVRIESLSVEVHAEVDVRGTLGMDPKVPVGFQNIRVVARLRVAPDTPPQRLHQLCRAAERACVVLQTLRAGVPVALTLDSRSG